MTRHGSSRRGFTLIELLVTAVVAIIMLGAAMALFTQSITQQHEQRRMAEMKRSAALVMGQLTTELRQAGLGRPRAVRLDAGAGAGANNLFPASILLARTDQIGFLADLPRPNSTFNGYSQLGVDQTASTLPDNGTYKGLALLNELNGSCDVVKKTGACATDVASHLFNYPTTTDSSDCSQSPGTARTCPWALNRYQGSEYIIVADSLGRWVERQVIADNNGDAAADLYGENMGSGRMALMINAAVPDALFVNGPNQGYVSTPDRVFFRLNNGWWERKQCWGSVGEGAPTLVLNIPCDDSKAKETPPTGTVWERLAHVGSKPNAQVFTYWKADGTQLTTLPVPEADLRLIKRVDIRLELKRPRYPSVNTVDTPDPIVHVARSSITLRQ
jgi:type II secretory pathway pseudopilin PulG